MPTVTAPPRIRGSMTITPVSNTIRVATPQMANVSQAVQRIGNATVTVWISGRISQNGISKEVTQTQM